MSSSVDFVSMARNRPVNVIAIHRDDDPVVKPHRHDYFEIVWCLSNKGFHSIDFIEYPSKQSRLYMIYPGQVHESTNLGDDVRIITFKKGFTEQFFALCCPIWRQRKKKSHYS